MSEKVLAGRVALITGASRGIGAAVAKAYASAGAHVVLVARNTAALEALDDEIKSEGGTATLIPLDLLDFAKVDTLGPALAEKFGRLDIFVGNAGMLGTLGPIAHGDAKEWDNVIGLNITANFRLIRTLDPLLRASDAGRVIITGSGTAHRPRAYWAAYRMTKAAVEMLALTYAQETEQTNLRVNVLYPGPTQTKLLEQAYPGGYQDDDVMTVDDLLPDFLALASPDCIRHGQVIVTQKK